MSTLATPQTATTTWNVDPVHSVGRIQGETYDDFQREGPIHRAQGVLTLDETDVTNSHVEGLDRCGFHYHPRTAARRASQERRLFRCGEVPDDVVQIHS